MRAGVREIVTFNKQITVWWLPISNPCGSQLNRGKIFPLCPLACPRIGLSRETGRDLRSVFWFFVPLLRRETLPVGRCTNMHACLVITYSRVSINRVRGLIYVFFSPENSEYFLDLGKMFPRSRKIKGHRKSRKKIIS